MKKLLSTILCLAMMLSLATPALAASSTTASGIRGEIWIDLTGVAYG